MRIDERLTKQNRILNRRPDPDDRDEDTLMYDTRKRQESLNESRGAFESRTYRGINSDPDFFDRTAVFRP